MRYYKETTWYIFKCLIYDKTREVQGESFMVKKNAIEPQAHLQYDILDEHRIEENKSHTLGRMVKFDSHLGTS